MANLKFINAGQSASGKTQVWGVLSVHSGHLIGAVKWYGRWRRYVIYPQDGTLFDAECLSEIAAFLSTQMEMRRCGD